MSETADNLRAAAKVIEMNGWTQRSFFESIFGLSASMCPVCVHGALNVAKFGEPVIELLWDTKTEMDYLARAIDPELPGWKSFELVYDWNDDEMRTKEDVLEMLERAAQLAERGEALNSANGVTQ